MTKLGVVISDVLAEATEKMDSSLEVAKEDFGTVRTGRANPLLFQKILVDYYGTPTPLGQRTATPLAPARLIARFQVAWATAATATRATTSMVRPPTASC